ncbi:MAG: restriction endonuclease subunit S [Gammaproteobacteria bacterium]|nr:restriction endonuclease subunit S [Gammaproteobacteria bacterium]MYE30396.1 restriction endonuclease subunit S [Gammaproteobacteria bacterium]
MAWKIVNLSDVAEQVRRPEVPQAGTPYRQIGVRLWGQGAYQRETIDGSETKYPALYEVRSGDIIVNKIWARNGSISVIPDDLDGSFGSSEFPTFSIDKSSLLPDWFKWFSKTKNLWAQCEKLSRGTSGQNRLRPERFLEVRLPLPTLEEQRRIAGRLDRLQALIQKRREAIAAVDADLDSLLLKAFERVIADAPYRPMSEVAPLVRRPVTEIDPDGSYPELGVRSFGRGTFHKPALAGIEVGTKRLFRIESGDVVFNNVFAWEGAVAIAQPQDDQRVGSHRFITCVPDPKLATAHFLLFHFLTPPGLQQLGEASPGGAGRNRTLGLKRLAAIMIPAPPIEAQHRFNSLLAKARRARSIREETSKEVEALTSAVLREAFGNV